MFSKDVGSNIGVQVRAPIPDPDQPTATRSPTRTPTPCLTAPAQVRKLFEPERYPGALMLGPFTAMFGAVDARRRSTCALGLEANARHARRLRDVERAHVARGWRTRFLVPVAAAAAPGGYTTAAAAGGGCGGAALWKERSTPSRKVSTRGRRERTAPLVLKKGNMRASWLSSSVRADATMKARMA